MTVQVYDLKVGDVLKNKALTVTKVEHLGNSTYEVNFNNGRVDKVSCLAFYQIEGR